MYEVWSNVNYLLTDWKTNNIICLTFTILLMMLLPQKYTGSVSKFTSYQINYWNSYLNIEFFSPPHSQNKSELCKRWFFLLFRSFLSFTSIQLTAKWRIIPHKNSHLVTFYTNIALQWWFSQLVYKKNISGVCFITCPGRWIRLMWFYLVHLFIIKSTPPAEYIDLHSPLR